MEHVARLSKSTSHSSLSVRRSESLGDVLEVFRQNRGLRLLTVLGPDTRPLGVIREIDVRELLFNPFGHALMQNPGIGKDIGSFVHPCPTAEYDIGHSQMLALYHGGKNSPGLIITAHGNFLEALASDQLLELSAKVRIARLERQAKSSQDFTQEIAKLADQLAGESTRMSVLAQSLHEQAANMTRAAQEVATGVTQSAEGLQDVSARGHRLAQALEQLTYIAAEAQAARAETHRVIEAAAPQMQALSKSGTEIGRTIEVIKKVGRQTGYLALNAQIEAVRQHSHNNGFIAVANEIKQLATQTNLSASEISGKIGWIGSTVTHVVEGHEKIAKAMDDIDALSDQIETAVQDQSATGLAIAGFVDQAAIVTADISQRAAEIGSRACEVQTSADALENASSNLFVSAQDICSRSQKFAQSLEFL